MLHGSKAGACLEGSRLGSREESCSDHSLISSKGADCSVLRSSRTSSRSKGEALVLRDKVRISSSREGVCSGI